MKKPNSPSPFFAIFRHFSPFFAIGPPPLAMSCVAMSRVAMSRISMSCVAMSRVTRLRVAMSRVAISRYLLQGLSPQSIHRLADH